MQEDVHIKKINRVGEISYTNSGHKMKIVSYTSEKNISVQFDDGFILSNVRYGNFKRGGVSNPYAPSLYNVGFMGYGSFDSKDIAHNIWRGMIERCYKPNRDRVKDRSYSECTVSTEWHNYQNFAKWYKDNYYKVDEEVMMLDKDILLRDNKVYSKESCIIVPSRINMLINGRSRSDCGEYPLGVVYHKATKKYAAACNRNGKPIHLGIYDTPQEAHDAYKIFKEKVIEEVAISYKDKIPHKLFSALITYKVE